MASIGQSKQTVQARAKQLKDGNAFLNYIETASEDGELATRWGTVCFDCPMLAMGWAAEGGI